MNFSDINNLDDLTKTAEDLIEGGRADDMDVKDVYEHHKEKGWQGSLEDIQNQIDKGIKVEMEHTDDPLLSKEIAKDHEVEFPDYYTGLDTMEKSLKDKE